MSTIKNIIIIALCAISTLGTANNLQITNIQDLGNNQVSFDIAWENAWRYGTDYHDAVWVFVKYRANNTTQWLHADVTSTTTGGNLEEVTQADQKGVFIRLNTDFQGNISATSITLQLGNIQGVLPDFKVFGIEMVYVPQGSFYIGDGAGGSPARYTMAGDTSQPYQITSEGALTNAIEHIVTDNSIAFTNNPTTQIDADFPKGYDAFYCMKYEITESQYRDFLNTLTRIQQNASTDTDISGTSITNRYVLSNTSAITTSSIKCDATLPADGSITFYCDGDQDNIPNESNDRLNWACRIGNTNRVFNYLDWAALRPMSSFEFEKAARGPMFPIPREYVWGSTQRTLISGLNNVGENTEVPNNLGAEGLVNIGGIMRVGATATATSSRSQAAAGYYGIMNLGDNAAEVMIAAYTENGGTYFTGSSGDGLLNAAGTFTNTDWKERSNGRFTIHRTGSPTRYNYTSTIVYSFDPNAPNALLGEIGGRGVR